MTTHDHLPFDGGVWEGFVTYLKRLGFFLAMASVASVVCATGIYYASYSLASSQAKEELSACIVMAVLFLVVAGINFLLRPLRAMFNPSPTKTYSLLQRMGSIAIVVLLISSAVVFGQTIELLLVIGVLAFNIVEIVWNLATVKPKAAVEELHE